MRRILLALILLASARVAVADGSLRYESVPLLDGSGRVDVPVEMFADVPTWVDASYRPYVDIRGQLWLMGQFSDGTRVWVQPLRWRTRPMGAITNFGVNLQGNSQQAGTFITNDQPLGQRVMGEVGTTQADCPQPSNPATDPAAAPTVEPTYVLAGALVVSAVLLALGIRRRNP
jgi:hypothetical protein